MKFPLTNSCHCDDLRYGFTLIEVMVSLAILAVLASLAAPNFSESIKRYRVNAVRDDLMASVQQARSEAIRRGASVSLIRRTASCGTVPADNSDWGSGWLLAPGTACVADTAATFIQLTSIPVGYRVAHTASDTTLYPNSQLTFDRWGQTSPAGTHTFTISPPEGDSSTATRSICMSIGGRVKDIKGNTC